MRLFSSILAAPLLLSLTGGAAFAQSTTVSFGGLYDLLLPTVLTLVGGVATVAAGWLGERANRWLGLNIDKAHRDALQTAITNGAGLVIAKYGSQIRNAEIDVGSPMLAAGIMYVVGATPDALKHFRLTPEDLAAKILAKLPQIREAAGTPASA